MSARTASTVALAALATAVILALAALTGRAQAAPDYPASARAMAPRVSEDIAAGLLRTTYEQGAGAALDELQTLLEKGRVDHIVADDLTHAIGMMSFARSPQEPARALAECRIDFGWGCFHGVAMGYMHALEGEPRREDVVRLCQDTFKASAQKQIDGSCTHGLGHGLVSATGDLARALDLCDGITELHLRVPCWDGAVSESIYDLAEGRAGPLPSADDPFTLCASIGSPYRPSCYKYFGVVLQGVFGDDWGAMAEACARRAEHRAICLEGLGRHANGIFARDVQRSVSICEALPHGRDDCLYGVLAMDARGFSFTTGLDVCRRVRDAARADECHRLLGINLQLTEPRDQVRQDRCASLAVAAAARCMEGLRAE